ncbi:TldD/PmbA family protein [Phaeobacter inhibens]|uniref:TldD/PmbA family protein n=1 Tax=Phaeobacter inhibens TaxID=221822 RepID=UPI000C998EB5|nr:TldD/PmbA family protein [Phaeobacter inhibens]AUQ64190.1 protein PmbA [Phaeobacter inhibens]AUQ84094.1 protein PmbA [Phaeobacter inhibens]AUQ91902.1 protein PmbA [Phaeobacter inhibens]MDO6756011.1 TldD/PmbA family protein [Phaeobacter inhibens]
MTQTPESLSHALLDAARKAGADAADAMVAEGSSLSIEVRQGTLEHAERSEGVDLGLRVFVGQRQACVSASDMRAETLTAMAERAVAMAREAPEDPYAGLAEPGQLAQDWDLAALELFDPSEEPAPAALQEDALAAETAGFAVPGVTQVQSAAAGYGTHKVHMAATNGFSGGYQRSSRSISCKAIAGSGTGMERDYDGDSRTFQGDLRSAKDIGTHAGERAIERLGARKPETGSYPVLFDERVSSSLIGHLLAAVNGASIARGSSWLKDALGEQILPTQLSVTEDPFRPRIAGSRPFDGEGLATQRRAIIDNGVLTGWTLDLASARKLDMQSTGNAARGVGSVPSPSQWNIALTQGNNSRTNLISGMGTGLLVTSMIGSTINPNTGDYSRGAAGFWVENGEIAYPVNECTIAGNLRDMLRSIVPANDARSHLSRVVPSLLVEGMTLAGN